MAVQFKIVIFAWALGLGLSSCKAKLKVITGGPVTKATGNDPDNVVPDGSGPNDPKKTAFRITGPSRLLSSTGIEVSWEDASAVDYVVLLSHTGDCKNPAYTFANITTTRQMVDVEEGRYFICVMANDANGVLTPAENNGYEIYVDQTPPGEFMIQTPPIRTNDNTPALSWTAASGVAHYNIRIAN